MTNKIMFKLIGIAAFFLAAGCATRSTPPAPVVKVTEVPSYVDTTNNTNSANNTAVAKSSTKNAKPKMEAIDSDEEVQTTSSTNSNSNKTIAVKSSNDNASSTSGSWQMPTDGTLGKYSASSKGVNITGTAGQPIYATASGKVLYSGNGLKGYGNLIIIRHDSTYLSAYAYNKANLVKEGASVKAGQKIATMGTNDSGEAMLHLEVRKNGKPIDPHLMIGN